MSRTKKITAQLFIILLVCIAAFCLNQQNVHGATTYESEPNNGPYQADIWPFADGNVFTGEVSNEYGSDGPDWIKFTMPKTGFLSLNVKSDDCTIYCSLYNSAAKKIEYPYNFTSEQASYNNALGYYSDDIQTFLSKGTYYIEVEPYYGHETGKYTLTIDFTASKDDLPEPNDYLGYASLIKTGKVYNGVIADSGMLGDTADKREADFIKVNIPSSGTYYVDCKFTDQFTENSFAFGFGFNDFALLIDEYSKNGSMKKNILEAQGRNKDVFFNNRINRGIEPVYLTKGVHYFKLYTYELPTRYSIDITKKLTAVSKVKASRTGSGKVKVSWAKKSGATGYKVYRKSLSTGKYICIGKTKTLSFVDKKAKTGRTNYYKVKAYKTINGYSELGFFSKAVGKNA